MQSMRTLALGLLLALSGCAPAAVVAPTPAAPPTAPASAAPRAPAASMSEILARSPAADWRAIDPEDTLYMDLPSGRVIIELAPGYAPDHASNIRALAREGYYDGAAIVRAQ